MSEVKVNKISPRTNCGTVQLGDSGDTITIPSGVTITNNGTQTGFGRTGTVNWDTTAKTAAFTAVSGNGYFINTTSAAITVTLPASPSVGDIVAVADYAGTASTNNITIARNSSNIDGLALDGSITTDKSTRTLLYVDATRGWVSVNDADGGVVSPEYVAATGGTVTTCGDFKIHKFTGPGTFCVSNAGNVAGSNTVDYLVVAGGGSGGTGSSGGGGGAGGFRESSGAASGCYTASPLGACVSALSVTATGYPITVGGGGNSGSSSPEDGTTAGGNSGSNSVFSTITSAGGGRGASTSGVPNCSAENGGSGGGGNGSITNGNGNTPPVSPPQGQNGQAVSDSPTGVAGGGGGATTTAAKSWVGRSGVSTSISGSATNYAGGGGGGKNSSTPIPSDSGPLGGGAGGNGGGGSGATGPSQGEAGGTNLGGGGGGGGRQNSVISKAGGNGGSGIVIIRYKFQ